MALSDKFPLLGQGRTKMGVWLTEFWGHVGLRGVDSNAIDTDVLLEDTGELKTVLHGKDSAGNIDPLRTNDNQQLQIEVINSALTVDPVFLSNSEADFYDPATTSSDFYRVYVTAVNVAAAGTNPTVIMGIDVGDAGSLADSEKFVDGMALADFESVRFGPFIMGGDDVLRGNSGTASAVAIHLEVTKIA